MAILGGMGDLWPPVFIQDVVDELPGMAVSVAAAAIGSWRALLAPIKEQAWVSELVRRSDQVEAIDWFEALGNPA